MGVERRKKQNSDTLHKTDCCCYQQKGWKTLTHVLKAILAAEYIVASWLNLISIFRGHKEPLNATLTQPSVSLLAAAQTIIGNVNVRGWQYFPLKQRRHPVEWKQATREQQTTANQVSLFQQHVYIGRVQVTMLSNMIGLVISPGTCNVSPLLQVVQSVNILNLMNYKLVITWINPEEPHDTEHGFVIDSTYHTMSLFSY